MERWKTRAKQILCLFLFLCTIVLCTAGLSVTASATVYESGATVAFKDLKVGDVLKSGATVTRNGVGSELEVFINSADFVAANAKSYTVDKNYQVETANDYGLYLWLNLVPIPVTSVSLNKTAAVIGVGSAETLTATVNPNYATDATVTWSTSNSHVKLYSNAACTTEVGTGATSALTVYAKGISNGSATVTVTTNDGNKTATCAVSVHTHNFTYSATGTTITATCTADGCTLDDGTELHNHAVTLTVNAPTLTTYGQTGAGISEKATLTGTDGFNTATGKTLATTDIKYVGRAGTTYSESAAAPTAAGNYTAKITVEEKTASVDYVIAKADPSYTTPTGLAATYGDALASVALPAGWSWADGTQLVGNVGTNPLKATFTPADPANYNTIENLDVNVTVAVKEIKVTADTLTKTYGDNDPTLTYQVDGLVGEDQLTGELEREKGENVGAYQVAQGTLAASANYTIDFTGADFRITRRTVMVKANNCSKTYGDADPELTYTASGLVGRDKLTGELARAAGETAGSYAITQGTLAVGDNYSLRFTGATLTIDAKSVKIVADDQKKDVETSDPTLTYTVEGLLDGDALTGSLARAEGEDVGLYAITLGTLTAGSNYVVDFTGATLTICATHVEADVSIDENAPDVEVEGIDDDFVDKILNEEEKQALGEGKEVKVYLEVIAIDEDTVPANDKAEIEKAAKDSDRTVGMYLDLSLLKKIGESDAVAIPDTNGNMVNVTVKVPEELRNTNPTVKRTFYVVRAQDGKLTVFGKPTAEETISFETDQFSTYSLVYKDVSFLWLWILIAVIVIVAIFIIIFFLIFKKKDDDDEDEEKKEEDKEEKEEEEKEDK